MTTRYLLLLPAILLIFSSACHKKGNDGPAGPVGPTGPAAPSYYGVITGYVSLYDEFGFPFRKNLDGIQISLNDSISTLTDINGHYIFDSVVTGNYNISVSKAGIGGTMMSNTVFLKDTLFESIKMSLRPDFDAIDFSAIYSNATKIYSLTATFTAGSGSSTRQRNCLILVGNSRSVNAHNYLLAFVKPMDVGPFGEILNKVTTTMSWSELTNAGLPQGSIAYYAVYSYVTTDFSAYIDQASGKYIYTAIGTPRIDSVRVP